MPIQTTCPSCSRTLRVPDNLIGKNVKCPGCQTTFIAADAEQPPPLPPSSSPADAFRETPSDQPRDTDDTYRAEPEHRGGPPPLPPPEEDYDDDAELEQDEERRHRRRRRDRTGNAMARVSGPATALQVAGGLSVAWSIISVILNLAGAAFLGGGPRGGGGPFGGNDPFVQAAGNILGAILGLVMGGLIIYGANEMKKLRSFGMAMTAAIIAIVPCHGCCLLGIPFGIWALVVLNDAEVKASFK